MKIYKNIISQSFIDQINSVIDEYDYSNSLYLFDSKSSMLHNLIRNQLGELELFKPIIRDAHIVIRCVKKEDKKIANYPHFDNYIHTYVIPIFIPKKPPFGDLIYKENMRSFPKNIYTNIFSKFVFQNPLVKNSILNRFRKYFLSISIKPGDVGYFNGLTTLHYNNPVSAERRSILIHTENPFKNSLLNKLIEYFGKLNVK